MTQETTQRKDLIPNLVAGVSPLVKEQLDLTETTGDVLGGEDIFLATENIGEATRLAWEAAQAWLEQDVEKGVSK